MKRFANGKLTAVLLAVALTLAMSAAAFAVWPSFQGSYFNNAVITGVAPPTSSAAFADIQLGSTGTEYDGVDAATVISSNIAYTLYDGGAVSGTSGGARLAVTNLTSRTLVGDYQIDNLAGNVSQLSTPYLKTSANTLYAATTYYEDLLEGTGPSDWINIATGQPLTSFTFPVGSTGIKYVGLSVPSDYWEPQLATDINISASGLSGDVSLTQNGIDFGDQDYYPGYGNWTLYNESGVMLNNGTYDLTFTVNNQTGSVVNAASIKFLVSMWRLWGINVSGATPSVGQPLASGYGQANTPIKYDSGQGSIYFGIYEGDRSYYKYEIGNNDPLTRFDAQDDFYWAGAVAVSSNSRIIFGSDSGKLYVQNNSSFGTSLSVINLKDTTKPYGKADAGKVRSTIVDSEQNYIYFTSSGTGNQAYLWRAELASIATANPNVQSRAILPVDEWDQISSVSTPVVSLHDYLYVAVNEYDEKSFQGDGQVLVFDLYSEPLFPDIKDVAVYTGVSVSASPIVYTNTDEDYDYIYFTTNSGNGAGYCYSCENGTSPVELWAHPNTSGNNYSLQGMAEDDGKVVWGDDGNKLYIGYKP